MYNIRFDEKIYLSNLSIYLSISLNGQVIISQVIEEKTGVKRNAFYNLEEIKVRWKKAALENCPGVPCPFLSAPGSCSSIVATPTGPYSASVSFIPPTTDGGSPITGYIVTATSTPSAPAKRKTTAAIITVSGTSSPIVVTGLTFGVNYIFSVVATNAVGPSPAITTPTTVTPCVLNTVSAGSTSPTLAVNTVLTNITHTTTIATGIGTVTGLPAGVTTSWSAHMITISGTPTATGSFSYIILLTGGCGIVNATGSITVSASPACAAAAASTTPTLTVNTVLTNITHATTSATGIGTASGLPTGVSAAWSSNTITISGTPSTTGTFNYTIPLTGTSCSAVNATGTITVSAACAAAAASTTPTLTVNTVLTNITHGTTSATGIGTASGLPTGVSAAWSSNTITISGTPSVTGTFNYTIPLTGTSCSSVNATGTITVSAACAAAAASTTPTLTVNTVLTNITHATTIATGIGTASGLPTGVTAAWSSNTITISGTPSTTGTFNYTIPLTGTSCSAVNATGTITVSAACAAAAASTTPTLTVNTVLTNITHVTTSATGIGTASGLPTGVTAAWSSNTITISGTPSVTGTFNYTIPLTGTSCSAVNATGTITVTTFTCGSSTISDIDGNAYTTVSINTRCWTVTNLRVRRYNDGTEIRFNNSGGSGGTTSETWSVLDYGAHTIYANDSLASPSKLTTYGYLYNWYAAKGIATAGSTTYKNICPTGWHVPTDAEWTTLTDYLSGASVAGGKMKSTSSLWTTPNTGADNTSGFTALPGGYRNFDGSFYDISYIAFFWSASEVDSSNAWYRLLFNFNSDVYRGNYGKSVGASVRCLRD